MLECPTCRKSLIRTHRTSIEKLIYRDVLRCTTCRHRVKRRYTALDAKVSFYFSRYTNCIRCGTLAVYRLSQRDRVDSMSRSLVSQLQRLSGAPLMKCNACRLQYYDWRPIARAARNIEPDA
jgi:transcription elongation factor Elf1